MTFKNNEFKNGLKAIEMERLGNVVAIFGPNGAGKTRLLDCIERIITKDNGYLKQGIPTVTEQHKKLQLQFNQQEEEITTANAKKISDPKVKKQLSTHKKNIKEFNQKREQFNESLERLSSAYSSDPQNEILLLKLSSNSQLPANQSDAAIDNTINQIGNWTNKSNAQGAIYSLLKHIVQARFFSKHDDIDNETIGSNLGLYDEVKRIVKIMMDMDLGYGTVGTKVYPTLGGRELNFAELSNGQRVILNYLGPLLSEMLSQHEEGNVKTLNGAILIMDEPELHLHPGALIEIINRLREVVGKDGQIWMGTHCISLLPHLRTNEIWIMESDAISPPTIENCHKAITLLVGTQENAKGLYHLLQEPFEWASLRFATECLMPPEKSEYKKNDPQFSQITEIIGKNDQNDIRTILVDYGAGKGRLAVLLNEWFMENGGHDFEYVPIEPDTDNHEKIIENSDKLLASCGVSKRGSQLLENYNSQADVVVLCNVLHEIPLTQWLEEFEVIRQLLSLSGSLIICEDQELPTGELPHKLGFIVLGAKEMEILLSPNTTAQLIFIHTAHNFLIC